MPPAGDEVIRLRNSKEASVTTLCPPVRERLRLLKENLPSKLAEERLQGTAPLRPAADTCLKRRRSPGWLGARGVGGRTRATVGGSDGGQLGGRSGGMGRWCAVVRGRGRCLLPPEVGARGRVGVASVTAVRVGGSGGGRGLSWLRGLGPRFFPRPGERALVPSLRWAPRMLSLVPVRADGGGGGRVEQAALAGVRVRGAHAPTGLQESACAGVRTGLGQSLRQGTVTTV
uniref:Uncharacterized protein LOC110193907 n=1 Tax=Phascolarctos cinereus TaxID=38626 RepID=A0A6P5ISN8_PHACI|nr:uncharacterized protein LOC110193907 [Phascolarctos cinereus]